ncbi:MAG: apolipoprotein N-acyltransferase [Gemmatimonadota bacterium]|nr:MAG: apolipoprotein N-acyltransferase [Gemmatimonadota bacterium]
MKQVFPGRRDWAPILLGAVLVTLAYPPFHLLVPSLVCLTPAVALLHAAKSDARPIRFAAVRGFWFGVAANALLLYWMPIALWRYTPLAAPVFVIGVLFLGLCTAAAFGLTGWIVRVSNLSIVIAFPTLWTALEWAVGHIGVASFPWLGLGTSLTGYPLLIQIADIVGARGLTWLLAAANAALALAWIHRRECAKVIPLVGSVTSALALVLGYGIVRMHSVELRGVGTVALIQPDVGYVDKWDPDKGDSIVRALVALSSSAIQEVQPDLVIWPETAIPGAFTYRPTWESTISRHARNSRTPILVGALHQDEGPDSTARFYNTAFWFDSLGTRDRATHYHKRRTVLLVERFAGIASGNSSAVFESPLGSFGVLICYESAFEELTRRYRNQGVDFIVNISNDAWFGGTTAPYQHEAHAVMRAIENRVAIARAANNGISEFVDPLGRRLRATEFGTKTFAAGLLQTSDVMTLHARLGDWVGALSALAALGFFVIAGSRRRPLQ